MRDDAFNSCYDLIGIQMERKNMRCARFDWIAFAISNWSRWTSSSHEPVKQKLVHVLNCFQFPGTFPGATKLIDKCFEFAESIENLISQVEYQNWNWCEQKSFTEQFDYIENLKFLLKRFNLWRFKFSTIFHTLENESLDVCNACNFLHCLNCFIYRIFSVTFHRYGIF